MFSSGMMMCIRQIFAWSREGCKADLDSMFTSSKQASFDPCRRGWLCSRTSLAGHFAKLIPKFLEHKSSYTMGKLVRIHYDDDRGGNGDSAGKVTGTTGMLTFPR